MTETKTGRANARNLPQVDILKRKKNEKKNLNELVAQLNT